LSIGAERSGEGKLSKKMMTTIEPILSGPRETDFPTWFRAEQMAAWEEFSRIAAPVRTDELWRFSSLKHLGLDDWQFAGESTFDWSELVSETGYSHPAARLVFLNERLVDFTTTKSAFAKTSTDTSARIVFVGLDEALSEHVELFRKHFMAQPSRLGSKRFAALHKALVRSGGFLYVPPGVKVAEPFEVFHIVEGEKSAIFPHTLVVVDENASATFLDHFISASPGQPGFACGVNDLVLGPGAKLTYLTLQDWSKNFASVQVNSTQADRDAGALSLSLNFGGRYSRLESVSRMLGEGARSDMLAVTIATGDQEFDQRTLQDHLTPNTTSDLLYKNSLNDRARTVFSGLIKVEPGAHRTDAYQKVRNLLLSDDVEANSLPGLEILADDVRCTHGATSGQVEPEELFYLQSRGIPELAAKALVVRGFLNEVVDRLPAGPLVEYLHQKIEARLRDADVTR
jgi:Fe-S cluster assembly protein SufD